MFVDRSETGGTFLVTKHDGQTSVRKVVSEDFDHIVSELGLRKSDIFQADAVVLVEGESDKRILQSYANTLGVDLDQLNIYVVPVGGKDSMRFYANARVLVDSRTPFRVILDRDGLNPEAVKRKLLGLDRHGRKIRSTTEKAVCKKSDLIVLGEHSIESYLLVPRAISSAFNLDEGRVENFLKTRTGKNKKRILNALFHKTLGRSYNEVLDGQRIADHLEKKEIHPEMRRIIAKRLPKLVQ